MLGKMFESLSRPSSNLESRFVFPPQWNVTGFIQIIQILLSNSFIA